jgi:hypothetical protein
MNVTSPDADQSVRSSSVILSARQCSHSAPAFGILVGGTINWTTLEGIVDTADMAYRRRFLLEKYPYLGDEEVSGSSPDAGPDLPDDADEAISVLGEIADAGGPDLR